MTPEFNQKVKPGPYVVNVTLNQLELEDIDTLFTYTVFSTELKQSSGKNAIAIQGKDYCICTYFHYNLLISISKISHFPLRKCHLSYLLHLFLNLVRWLGV